MKMLQRGFTIIELMVVVMWLTAIGGWIANVYKLVAYFPATFTELTPLMVFRTIGVFVAPLGAVLGFF